MTELITPVWPLTVFYDGGCPVCSREIAHYRRLEHGARLEFVDISAPGFVPESYGHSLAEFMARMHVRDANGRFAVGVDAFPLIWQALPHRRYHLAARLLQLPGIRQLASLAYRIFAANRHRLRNRSCPDNQCHR